MTNEHSRSQEDSQEEYAQHPYEQEVLIDFWTDVAASDWEGSDGQEG
jgi:tRNA nucleotidyltransferase (CCA-adding enzyme)